MYFIINNITLQSINRRHFVKSFSDVIAGLTFLPQLNMANNLYAPADPGINIHGPLEGYSPQLGDFVSMLN